MNLNKIKKSILKAEDLRLETQSAYQSVLDLIIPFLDFKIDSEWDDISTYFHVEYQPSDGVVIGDNDSMVYSITAFLEYIKKNGSFTSLEDLKRNCSI